MSDPNFPVQYISITQGNVVRRRSRLRRLIPQALATTSFGMLIFSVSSICTMSIVVTTGLLRNESAPLNEAFNSTSEEYSISKEEANLVASLVYLVQPLGSLGSAFLQEKFGRRNCMMGVTLPQFAGWLLIRFSSSITELYIASIVMGLSIGFMEAPAMSFLGEVCQPEFRGSLSVYAETYLMLGILFEFLLTAILPWRDACSVSTAIPVIVFLILALMPESPTWLVVKGRMGDAEKSLRWLRGWVTPEEVAEEMNTLTESIKSTRLGKFKHDATFVNDTRPNGGQPKKKIPIISKFKLLLEPRVGRPVLLVATFFLTGHCLSLLGPRNFFVSIFEQLNLPVPSGQALVIAGSLQYIGSVVSCFFIHTLGKRIMAFLSLVPAFVSCFVVGIYCLTSSSYPWVPFIFLCFIFFVGGFGVMPLPWVLVCEVFPLDGKGIAAGLTAALAYVFSFLVTKTYIYFEAAFGFGGTLILYGIIGVIGTTYIYFELPETEGKTLEEIELHFNKEKRLLAEEKMKQMIDNK